MTLQYHYIVPGDDFVHAGEASGHLKGVLRQLGYPGGNGCGVGKIEGAAAGQHGDAHALFDPRIVDNALRQSRGFSAEEQNVVFAVLKVAEVLVGVRCERDDATADQLCEDVVDVRVDRNVREVVVVQSRAAKLCVRQI